MTENTQVGEAHGKVDSAHSNAQAFISDETVGTSQTRAGANSWMSSYIGDVNKHLGKIKSTKVHNLTVRESMHTQAEKGRELSPVLLSESDIAESKRTPPLTLTSDDGKVVEYVTPEAYLTALEEQKNAKREAAAKEILAQIDKEAYAEEGSIFVPKEDYVPGRGNLNPIPALRPRLRVRRLLVGVVVLFRRFVVTRVRVVVSGRLLLRGSLGVRRIRLVIRLIWLVMI